MKLNWKDITLDALHLLQEILWLILGVSVGAWGVATQPEAASIWSQPNVPALIAGLFVFMALIALTGKGLDRWWNRPEEASERVTRVEV